MKSIEELVNEPWKRELTWDVTHAQALEMVANDTMVFDERLSYETTGYRPIDEVNGLDFDPLPFKRAGLDRMQSDGGKKYNELIPNTKAHKNWWLKEHHKSEDGVVINNYRVTGDHYFFLNYYTMLVAELGQKAGSGRLRKHPDFWVLHYKWFHYIELAEMLGFDALALKGRGLGFSEVGASLGVRPYTTTREFHTMYVASYEPYLTGKGIIQKCWTQLDWLNQNTNGGMRRARSLNQGLHKKSGVLDKQGVESGHGSQISGQVVDKADKLRGDRTERLIFEEFGSNPVGLDSYAVSEALVIINGIRVGIRILFGTGGDTDITENKKGQSKAGIMALEAMFLNPRGFRILPHKHKNNNKNQYVETGFFAPSFETVQQVMDKRGFVKPEDGKREYQKERDKRRGIPDAYAKYCAEYCFTYEEALSRKGSNMFNQNKLADQRIEVEIHKSTPKPKRGFLKWIYAGDTNQQIGVKFTENNKGDVEIFEEPQYDEQGNHIPNLYIAGIDSIDAGSNESSIGDKGSKFCILIKKRSIGLGGNIYVAKYLDRPSDARQAYERALQLMTWYNCKANLEDTKIGLRGYFSAKNKMDMLMRRPKYALENQAGNKTATALYGTPATPKNIQYGLELVRDYIEDYSHNIFYIDMLTQLQDYSDEFKGKFDIVAAMQMTEIADQELSGVPVKRNPIEKWQDIGFYTDAYGRKRRGIIQK
jgi:hypothetical protein